MNVTYIALFLWLADVCDNFKAIFMFILGLGGGGVCILIAQSLLEGNLNNRILKFLCLSCVLIGFVVSVIPSKNTIYLIGGTYIGAEVIDKATASNEYKKLMELFNLSIDKALAELKKEEKK